MHEEAQCASMPTIQEESSPVTSASSKQESQIQKKMKINIRVPIAQPFFLFPLFGHPSVSHQKEKAPHIIRAFAYSPPGSSKHPPSAPRLRPPAPVTHNMGPQRSPGVIPSGREPLPHPPRRLPSRHLAPGAHTTRHTHIHTRAHRGMRDVHGYSTGKEPRTPSGPNAVHHRGIQGARSPTTCSGAQRPTFPDIRNVPMLYHAVPCCVLRRVRRWFPLFLSLTHRGRQEDYVHTP